MLRIRLEMAGLAILKHMHNLSDEVLCERWIENPYYQLFCGEEFFQHALAFDRSSMTRWRQRMGEEKLVALIQESLNVATRTGAAKPADFSKVIVDTTVQPKAVAFPTDARLMHRARERLIRLAKKHGAGPAPILRARRQARSDRPSALRPRQAVQARQSGAADVAHLPWPGDARHRAQDQGRRGAGGGLRRAPDAGAPGARAAPEPARAEGLFAARAGGRMHRQGQGASPLRVRRQGFSIATTLHHSKGGQFIAHAKALPGNPYDGHTLEAVIPEIEAQIGVSLARIIADRGYRGHNAPPDHRFKVYISGQKRRVTDQIKRELRRRSAVEPVIGHAKGERRMGRNHLAGQQGDAINAVLAAAGYNFRRLLAWLELLLIAFLFAMARPTPSRNQPAAA